MGRGEPPRTRLVGPPSTAPFELIRWLLESRGRPFEVVERGGAPRLEFPEGAATGLLACLDALDARLPAREGLFPDPDHRAFVERVATDPGPVVAEVEAALVRRAFLGGAQPDVRDVAFAVLAGPSLTDAVRPAAQLSARVLALRPPVRAHGRVPADRPRLLQRLVTPWAIRGGMRVLAARGPRVLKLGKNAFVARFEDVQEVLRRDSDFLIGPVNATRIEGVMGPFILGMDAGLPLFDQREALYAALEQAGPAAAAALAAGEAGRLAEAAARRFGAIDVVDGYARPIAARAAADLFGVRGPTEADLMCAARAVFHETFLNLGGDAGVQAAGRAAGAEIATWIGDEVARRKGRLTPRGDLLDRLQAQVNGGALPAEQVPWITAGLLVGAIDTTATAVANIVVEAVRDPALLTAMTAEVDDPRRLLGWCLEALRRRPHNPLVLRETAADTPFAGTTIPAKTRVWALTLGAMQDARVFPDPGRLDPARPLDLYLHFGGGLHRCSGRQLNVRNIPALVAPLLRHGVRGPADLRFRGPFPDRLVVRLESPA